MPRSKSAQKSVRSGKRKQARNRSMKSATKTNITKAEKLIRENDLESAQIAVQTTISVLDKAAKKGVIHPNTVSRRKSRLMKKLNIAKRSQTSAPKPVDTTDGEATTEEE